MSKKIQLSIAEPCHENWDNMSPVDKGKFCGSCQKQVVDFSMMSDRQVAEFFKKPSTGSVCGRFMNDQLDREIEIPKKRIPWVKYFFQIALPAFLVSVKASAQTQKTGKSKQVTTDTTRKSINNEFRTLGMVATNICIKPIMGDTIIQPVKGEIAIKTIIKGKVVDENGQPVPFANIETGRIGVGIMADSNGVFELDKNLLAADKKLFVSSVGFESKEIIISKKDELIDELYIQLIAKSLLPEVVVKGYGGYTTKGKVMVGSVTKVTSCELNKTEQINPLLKSDINLPITINRLHIYPNPVASGSTVNIAFNQLNEGYYAFQIVNISGQMIQQKEIWIDSEARLLNIDVPSVAVGSYFMILTNKKTGKKFSEKVIIQ
jgi:CarboxypepD_reg-like domain/Secretion system C-terminal sorting domain